MMTHQVSKNLSDVFAECLKALRRDARRVLVQGKPLTAAELAGKRDRMKLFKEIGHSFRLTEREMVSLIFAGVLHGPRRCGCPTCRVRRESGGD